MKKLVAIGETNRRIGEDHPKAVLSNAQVDEVFEMRERGLSYGQIARRFKVTRQNIRDVLSCRTRAQYAVRFKEITYDTTRESEEENKTA